MRKVMNPIPFSNKNFQKIIEFYLFECPARTRGTVPRKDRDPSDPQAEYRYPYHRVSKRGLTFEDRGLDGPNLNSLRAAMKRVTDVRLIAVDKIEEVISTAEGFGDSEYIVIWKNERISVTEGYFYCIRNAFAHGDFDVDGKIYTFKNETGKTIKGLARLNESSLLTWIDLVNMKLEDIKKAGKK